MMMKKKMFTNQKKRYRKGSFFIVKESYCFRPSTPVGVSRPVECMKPGDIGQVTGTRLGGDELGVTMTFRTKDGKFFHDDTAPVYLARKLRKLDLKDKKDRKKKESIWDRE